MHPPAHECTCASLLVIRCTLISLLWLTLDCLAGCGPSQGPRPPIPLEPSDDAGIQVAARAFLNLPNPIEAVCKDKKSTFFHFLFSVSPKIPEKYADGWKRHAKESVAKYARRNCTEAVLVQAVHGHTLRLEIAFQVEGQAGKGDTSDKI